MKLAAPSSDVSKTVLAMSSHYKMRTHMTQGFCSLIGMFVIILLLHIAPLVTCSAGSASTSREFFALLTQPGIQTIYLHNDISLELRDAPLAPVNLTTSLSIVAGVPAPQLTSLAANYIANKLRLRLGVTLTFNRIILSGILRGTGQHLDMLSRSEGGAVVYVNTINHRAACLPFDLFFKQLSSLPPPRPDAGMAGRSPGEPRVLSVQNTSGPLCWETPTRRDVCMSPYLDVVSYSTYNQIIDGEVPGNGGYNSFFDHSFGVCDQEISSSCLASKGADLCLAAALTSKEAEGEEEKHESNSPPVGLAIGLGVGLGGALLLSVGLIALFVRSHWRQRREALAASSKLSAGFETAAGSASTLSGARTQSDLEKGGGAAATAAAAGATAAGTQAARRGPSSTRLGEGGGKGGGLPAPMTARSTLATGSAGSSSNSGVTIEASSVVVVQRGAEAVGASAGAGLGEVEAARLHLLANAARRRGGRSAPLDVEVLQLLGQGSFGKVYKGIWHGTLVALKAQVLPPSLSGDARRRHMAVMEAAISSAINHPAIVQTFCYSFRPIKDTVGRTVVVSARAKPSRSLTHPEEQRELRAGSDERGDEGGDEGCVGDSEDYGHELLLVLEYCDCGSLRAALDKGTFHAARPWPWDWRRALQAASVSAAAEGGAAAAAAGARPTWRPPPGVPPDADALAQMWAAIAACGQVAPASTSDGHKRSGNSTDGATSRLSDAVPHAVGAARGRDGTLPASAAAGGGSAPPAPAATGATSAGIPAAATTGPSCRQVGTVHASDLPSQVWPVLDAYEPDFTDGKFEVLVPAADLTEGEAPAAVPASVTDLAPGVVVGTTLAGAPTVATSLLSSFSNGVGSSAADNAAAAAAADRVAMMYFLQQAAAMAAAANDPGVGGYVKVLAEFANASNFTRMDGLVTSSMGAGSEGQAAAGEPAGCHSSEGTMIAPPAALLAAAGLALPGAAGGSSAEPLPISRGASDARIANSAVGSREVSSQPQPAIRYGMMLAVAADVAGGLLHLHAHGVVHGDVKASNVLLKQIAVSDPWEAAGRAMDWAVSSASSASEPLGPPPSTAPSERGPRLGLCAKVSDFGLSTMLSAANTDSHMSATTAAGSLSHMSPELLLCGHISKANDIYAYGVLLFELFTGERAWEGMPRALLPARVALEGWRPVFPPHTPPAYRQLAECCWRADPASRPQFEDVVAALKNMRHAAQAVGLHEWVPVPNPQLAFIHQLLQRRPAGSISSPPRPALQQHQQQLAGNATPPAREAPPRAEAAPPAAP